jgi:5-methylcytosine-specific restriction endonuclease McrA
MNSRKIKEDILGYKFGKLTVLEFIGSKTRNNKYHKLLRFYKCLCDCGSICEKFGTDLKSGTVTSCGCWRKEIQIKIHTGQISKMRYAAGASKRTAKDIWKSSYSDGLPLDDFLILSQLNCHYCGVPPSNKSNKINPKSCSKEWYDQGWWTYNGLDRIDSSQNHNKNNVVPCCWKCNRGKSSMTHEEFMEWISLVYNHNQTKKT